MWLVRGPQQLVFAIPSDKTDCDRILVQVRPATQDEPPADARVEALDLRDMQPKASSRLAECVAAHKTPQSAPLTGGQRFSFALGGESCHDPRFYPPPAVEKQTRPVLFWRPNKLHYDG